MRKHNSLLQKQANDNPACPSSNIESGRCKYIQIGISLSGGGTYSFAHTDFDLCESDSSSGDGGAIYCTLGSLTIENCTFTECTSSGRGGSVYFECSYACTDIGNSFTSSSSSSHTGTFDEFEATGSVHKSSKYIHSVCNGYFGTMNVEATADGIISSCIFIDGNAPLYSGLLSFTKITGAVSASDCLFAFGKAGDYGGAFGTYGEYHNNPRPYFYFSFFCNNVCSDPNRGADIDANGTTGQYYTKNIIIHCFSASQGLRIHISEQSNSEVDNWLPQANMNI